MKVTTYANSIGILLTDADIGIRSHRDGTTEITTIIDTGQALQLANLLTQATNQHQDTDTATTTTTTTDTDTQRSRERCDGKDMS